jgi:hypothetical protein
LPLLGEKSYRFACWLGCKFHRLFGEGIDSAASFGCWLIDDRHLHKAWNYEFTGLVQLFVTHGHQFSMTALTSFFETALDSEIASINSDLFIFGIVIPRL